MYSYLTFFNIISPHTNNTLCFLIYCLDLYCISIVSLYEMSFWVKTLCKVNHACRKLIYYCSIRPATHRRAHTHTHWWIDLVLWNSVQALGDSSRYGLPICWSRLALHGMRGDAGRGDAHNAVVLNAVCAWACQRYVPDCEVSWYSKIYLL